MSTINKIPATVSLQHVVANFLNERNDYSQVNFKRWLQIAVMGFSDISMNTARSTETVFLTPDDKGQVRLPDYFVDYVKVGVNLGGKFYVLSKNPDIIVSQQTQNGDVLNESYGVEDDPELASRSFFPYTSGLPLNPIYGYSYKAGTGNIPAFNIDYENKVIQLSSAVSASQLIVEFISTGVSLNGNTFIPRYLEMPLLEYLHWRERKNDPKFSRGEVIDAKTDYLEALAQADLLESVPTYQEIMDIFYETAKQTIKR